MIDHDDRVAVGDEFVPAFAALTEQITEEFLPGGPISLSEYIKCYPRWAGAVRQLLPIVRDLVGLGQAIDGDRWGRPATEQLERFRFTSERGVSLNRKGCFSSVSYLATSLVALAVTVFSGCSGEGDARTAPVEGSVADSPEVEAITKSGKSSKEVKRLLQESKLKAEIASSKLQGRSSRGR